MTEKTKKLRRASRRDKHQIFSIRKFNVGVASVAIAAFWMVSGQAVAADSLDTAITANDDMLLVTETPEESSTTSAETPELDKEVTPEAENPKTAPEEVTEETPVVEETVEETSDNKESSESEATAGDKAENPQEEADTSKTETPAAEPETEAPVVRVAVTTYRVQYIDAETGETVKQKNDKAQEETTNATDEPHTFNVTVDLDTPAGYTPLSATNAAGQELAIVNNAIAAAIVEKNNGTHDLFVTVRKDDTSTNTEGRTLLFAATESASENSGIIETPKNATSSDYAISGAWEYSNPLPYEKDEKNFVSKQTEYQNIYTTATTVIPRENSSDVTVTVTVYDLEDQTPENANRVQIQKASENQSSYGGTSDHFELVDAPSEVPALDIRVRPNRLTEGEDPNTKFNFNGEYDSGYITIEFSEPVTDPVIDLSGVGGNVMGTGRDHPNEPSTGFVRGSFNSTVWEYQGTEALEISEGAKNLQVNGKRVEVIDKNTTARVQDTPSRIGTKNVDLGNFGTSAGTGSIKIVGTVTSLTFKLIHQATPVSEFAYHEGANTELILRNDGIGGTDGINGLDRDMNDDGHYYTYQSDGASGMLSNLNADLQRFSLRLPTGWVTVDYVDTEGNPLGVDTYTDTNKGTSANIGITYDTQEDENERPYEIEYNGKTYRRVAAGDYTVGTVGENGELTETTTDYGTDPVTGEVELGQKRITYVYEEVNDGDVVVRYHLVDENGEVIERDIQPEVVDTPASKEGTTYDTTDSENPDAVNTKPAEINLEDGRKFTLVDDSNPHATSDGELAEGETEETHVSGDETGEVTGGKTTVINYYYEEVKGDVMVHYVAVDAAGNPIDIVLKEDVVDTEAASGGTAYNTAEDYKPTYIEATDGKVYQLVSVLGTNPQAESSGDDEIGKVVAGEIKEITYYYEEVPTKVNVHYYAVDDKGNVIEFEDGSKLAEDQEDTKDATQGTAYDTTDDGMKPDKIVKEGVTYKRVDINDTNPHAETDGDDEQGVTEVTLNEDGTVDDTKDVNYYYERISGDVNVHYFAVDDAGNVIEFEDGQPLAASVKDEKDADIDKPYDTTDNRPPYLTRDVVDSEAPDGETRTYKRVNINGTNPHNYTDGDDETGKVVEGPKDVNYYYEHIVGNVHVRHYIVDEKGEVVELAEELHDTLEGEIDEPYNTADNNHESVKPTKPDTIVKDGKTYKRVDINGTNPHVHTDGDAEQGNISEKDLVINYYYELITGDVVVHYVDIEGNTIADDVVDTEAGNIDEVYNTDEDNKPDTIEVKDADDNVTEVYYLTERTDMDDADKTAVENGAKQEESTEGTGPDTVKHTGTTAGDDAKIVEGTTHVTYVYEKSGGVVVNYIAVDQEGNVIEGLKLKEQAVDEKLAKPGKDYDTTDLRDDEIVLEDDNGRVFRRVDIDGTNPHAYTDGDSEDGQVESGTVKEVNYYYEEVLGNVVVHYKAVDKDGNPLDIVIKEDVEDTKPASNGTDYNTAEDHKPTYIKAEDGKVYQLVSVLGTNPHAETDGDDETGTVVAGETKEITYYYEEVPANVNVHYFAVDDKGNVIEPISGTTTGIDKTEVAADEVETQDGVELKDAAQGVEYDTTDLRPATITTADGTVYQRVDLAGNSKHAVTDGDAESGTTEVTLNEDGTVDDTKDVNYYYVAPKTDVVVNYIAVDDEGNELSIEIAKQAKDTIKAKQGTDYNTAEDLKPSVIVDSNGDVWQLVSVNGTNPHAYTDGDAEEGQTEVTVNEDGTVNTTKTVNYYYEKVKANVNVHYHVVDESGKVVEKLGGVTATVNEDGEVVEDGGSVEETEKDTENADQGTDYNTAEDLRPDYIIKDGVTYKRVDLNGTNPRKYTDGDDEIGQATVEAEYDDEGNLTGSIDTTKDVNYYYERISGNVEVHYHIVDAAGNTLTKDAINKRDVETDAEINTIYDTTTEKDPYIIVNGKVYVLTETPKDDDSAEENGKVTEGTKVVNYYYVEQPTNVVVNYYAVDKEGKVILDDKGEPVTLQAQANDTFEALQGVDYDTTDDGMRPDTIFVDEEQEDGSVQKATYRRVDIKGTNPHTYTDGDAESGQTAVTVDKDGNIIDTKVVNYYYEKVTGDVIVHYVDVNGKVIAADVVDTQKGNIDSAYNTEDHKPATITAADGTVYYLTAKETEDKVEGEVIEGTTHVTYIYEKAGHVEVHYHIVDENGTVITEDAIDFVKDTENGKPGSEFDTTDHKPAEITVNGVTYILVADLTKDAETGDVISDDTHVVNYYYVIKPNPVLVPATPAIVGDELSDQDKDKVANSVNIPTGSTAKVTSPIKTNANGEAVVEVTVTDAEGNVTIIEVLVETSKVPTTIWVTEDGQILRGREEGSLEESAFAGYEYVGTEVDEDGHTTHIFRPITRPSTGRPSSQEAPRSQATYVTATTTELPNTGEASNTAALTGFGMFLTMLGLAGKRRRKED